MLRRVLRSAWRRLVGPRSAAPFIARILDGRRLVGADVGAAGGPLPHLLALHGQALTYCFEPHPGNAEELARIHAALGRPELYRILPVALSRDGGPRTFYASNVPSGSSILPMKPGAADPRSTYLYPMRESAIETRRLRDVLDELGEPSLDFIKLDVQGSELEILQGLDDQRLERLLLVELEVGLHDAMDGQASFGEVEQFARGRGLELFDLRIARAHTPLDGDRAGYQREVFDVHDRCATISARAWELDGVVYFRRPDRLLAERDAAAIRRLIVLYGVYNYFADAHALVTRARDAGALSAAEAEALAGAVVDWHREVHRRFYDARGPLHDAARAGLRRVGLGGLRWAQYTWLDYPNG